MWWRLLWWVISYALSDYFREKLPAQTASGIGDFNIPTATEGRSVPIIPGGSPKCRSLNCIWYGDFAAVERTVTTGVIFKRDETIGFTYELALQYALFKGECAGITGVWIGDDRVFDHVVDNGGVPAPNFVDIDRDDLFGGVDDGGGFVGRIRLFNGSETQGVSGFLNTRIAELPAYRGTCYVMVTNVAEDAGANIGEAPNLRYITIEVQAFDTVANGALGDVLNLGNDHHFIGPDANPVSVAYDLLTNTRWGRAIPFGDVNLANFQAAAEVIFTEGLGYTQLIDEQTSTGEIQDTLEQHMDAYIGPNPITGKMEISLARFDYVLATEFQADNSNIVAIPKWNKGDWSQTFNRVRLRYSDRAKEWNETHAVAIAAGNRIIQGKTATKEIRYQGVHSANVAQLIAARDLRNLAQPTSSGTIHIDRTAYQLRPGDVFSFTSDEVGETDLAVRIVKAGVGNDIDNTMEFEVTADVFDSEVPNVAAPPPTEFIPPVQGVVPFAVTDQAAFSVPFILMRYDALPNTVPRIATLARRTGGSPIEYEVIRRIRNPPTAHSGPYTSTDFVTAGFCSVGTLRNNETAWQTGNGGFSIQIDPIGASSLDALIDVYSPTNQNAAGIAVISPGLPTEEWIAFDQIVDDLSGIRLENTWRACMDTPMKPHTIGEQVWFIWTGGLGMGQETYLAEDGIEMKFLPRSPNDAVLEAAATALPEVIMDGIAPSNRQSKPLLPIELEINLAQFPATADFERFITQGTNIGLAGLELRPKLRAFNQQSIIASVQGLAFDGTGFNPSDVTSQVLELEAWLHDLDFDPTGDRANALVNFPLTAQATANDFFEFLKSAVIAGGATGFEFNARVEIEMRHSPAGQFPNQISHDTMDFDFLATGIFSVEADGVTFQSHFDGIDAATVADDVSGANRFIRFEGAAQIDTAQSVFGGASLLLDGIDSFVRTPIRQDWDIATEWTVEVRVRFTADPAGSVEICGQMDGTSTNSWTIAYTGGGNRFEFGYTTTGSNGPFFVAMHTGTWIPVALTWYDLAFCKEPDGTFHVFVDGVQVGSTASLVPSWFRSGCDLIIGARNFNNVPLAFFDGHFDEIRLTPRCLYRADYTIATAAFDDSRRNFPLLSHFDGTNLDTSYVDESLFNNSLSGWKATTFIASAQAMFGATSLECGGINGAGAAGDGILVPYQPGQNLGAGDWTMEIFQRYRTLPSTNVDGYMLLSKYNRGANALDWFWYVSATHAVVFGLTPTGIVAQQTNHTTAVQTIIVDTWYHFAAQRRGNDLELYFNGNRIAQVVDHFVLTVGVAGPLNQPDNPGSDIGIGTADSVSSTTRYRAVDGWIDEPSFEHGVTRYNGSTYVVPVAPTVDPKHNLLINEFDDYLLLTGFEGSDGFATDNTTRTEDILGTYLWFGAQAQIDTANFKFGTSSLLLDGNADGLLLHNSTLAHNLRGDDFTIDCWADLDILPQNSANGGMTLVAKWTATGNQRSWAFYLDDTGASSNLVFAWSVDGTIIKTAFVLDYVPVINTWTHFEVSRSGSTLRMFINGVLQTLDAASDAITTDIIFETHENIYVGWLNQAAGTDRDFDGHIDELRIIRRNDHTATFTPETVPYVRPALPWY